MAKLSSTSLSFADRPGAGAGRSEVVDRIASENQGRLAALTRQADEAAAGRRANIQAAEAARHRRLDATR